MKKKKKEKTEAEEKEGQKEEEEREGEEEKKKKNIQTGNTTFQSNQKLSTVLVSSALYATLLLLITTAYSSMFPNAYILTVLDTSPTQSSAMYTSAINAIGLLLISFPFSLTILYTNTVLGTLSFDRLLELSLLTKFTLFECTYRSGGVGKTYYKSDVVILRLERPAK